MTDPIKPIAYGSRNADGDISMLHFDLVEARTYCDEGEDPAPLYGPDVAALVRQMRSVILTSELAMTTAVSALAHASQESGGRYSSTYEAVSDALAATRHHPTIAAADAFLAQQEGK